MTNKRAVVLLSGGLDSSTVAYHAVKQYGAKNVYPLTVWYAQRHKRELESAEAIANELGIPPENRRVVHLPMGYLLSSALTNPALEVPLDRGEQEMGRDIPITYVPGRNTIFLALAASLAEDVDADVIYCGVNAQDYSGYPDCRPEFIGCFNSLLTLSSKRATQDHRPISIEAPIIEMRKEDIVRLGERLGVKWALTWSCYEGGTAPCGKCDSCILRAKGFREADVIDPLVG